jgi:prepilin-type N-terminal cleavage/methylation domain-containing protein
MKRNNNTGFTLIELMIVIAIIGILSMVLVPKVSAIKTQAKEAGLDTNVRMIRAYAESKIELWSMKKNPVSDIQNSIAQAFGTGKELTNPITMQTTPAPAVGADLDVYPQPSVYVAGTFDGLDIGNADNRQSLIGTIVVAVKGTTNEAAASIQSIHIYAHNHNGVVISETIVFADGTTTSGTPGTKSVTGISLDKTSLVLSVGNTELLTAIITPPDATNRNVIWSSDNPGIAEVTSSGLVTGISEGTAIIAAETEDGGYQAFCTVTVSSLPDYPAWDPSKRYTSGSYVLYGGRVFENWHDVDPGIEPTVIYPYGGDAPSPWREITDEWRPYNQYAQNDLVWHNGKQYRAKWWTQGDEPGTPSASVWELIE